MLDIKARAGMGRVIGPLIRWMAKTPITPTWITIAGLLVMVGGSVMIAAGWWFAGAAVATVGAILDAIDGPLARATGMASTRGAFLDTVSDRLGEIAVLVAIAYVVAGDPLLVVLVALGLGASLMVPYVRSKAEGAGAEGRGGLMGRAERLILILSGIGLEGLGLPTLEASLWILVVLTSLTVAQRVYRTWVQLYE